VKRAWLLRKQYRSGNATGRELTSYGTHAFIVTFRKNDAQVPCFHPVHAEVDNVHGPS